MKWAEVDLSTPVTVAAAAATQITQVMLNISHANIATSLVIDTSPISHPIKK